VIEPDKLRPSPAVPVIIESITADDRPLEISDSVVRIPPGRGKLEIHYTACNLQSPEGVAFRYILEGNDENWTATNRRSVNYTNLPPGDYRFRVTAAGAEATVRMVWEPHFYQTAWFYAAGAMLLILGGWAGLRVYDRQTQARYAMILAERSRLAREMHDTVIQGCVGVSTLLEAAATAPAGSTSGELLDRAREQVRVTLDEARQAVWNLRHDSERESVVGALEDFARKLSSERGIPVETEVAGEPEPMEGGDGRNLVLLAREAMRNAAAHANPSRIAVLLSFAPREVRLEVKDDGCGFDPAAISGANGHYGIMGMRERVEQLGGSLEISSSLGQGTRVIASVPRRGTT
jgi:signal transduction histidine kinase